MAEAIETTNEMQEQRKMRLEMARLKTRVSKFAKSAEAAGTKINLVEGVLVLGFAILMDIIDWLGLGSIPLIGDIFDLFTGAVIYFWVKIRGLDQKKPWFISWMSGGATLIELIPGGDLLPSYTLAVILIMIFNTSWGRRWAKILSPV